MIIKSESYLFNNIFVGIIVSSNAIYAFNNHIFFLFLYAIYSLSCAFLLLIFAKPFCRSN